MTILGILKKLDQYLFSTRAAGIYMLLFAIAIGAATFVENDFGTSSAQALIFRARWFEVLLVLFSGAVLSNVFRYRMVQNKKWASLIFHGSILIIIAGAGVTRYFGYEGMMHIREGSAADRFLSTESFLKWTMIMDGKSYSYAEPTYFSSLGDNSFSESYQIGNQVLAVRMKEFIPNPAEKLEPSAQGAPIMKVVVAGRGGREEYFLRKGDRATINAVKFNFTDELIPGAFNVIVRNDSLLFATDTPVSQMVMATQQQDTIYPGGYKTLMLRSMYNVNGAGFVIGDFRPNAVVNMTSAEPKMKNESTAALRLEVSVNNEVKEVIVTGRKGDEGQPQRVDFGNISLSLSYGAKYIQLPFSIQCRDFIMERYPGTDNPSSYASEVTLIDGANGVNMPYRIFMNNILDYGGFRFFQSSFDQDELGTYLSVNHDFWGTWISYIGYILLTIGMAMTFFAKNSRFTELLGKISKYQQSKALLLMLVIGALQLGMPVHLQGQDVLVPPAVSSMQADDFGTMLVQDHKGRIKPVNTLSGEVLRKVAKKESLYSLSADQIFLSMMIQPAQWEGVPLIHQGSHPGIQQLLGTTEKLVSYRQFFGKDGQYVLREAIREAQAMNPKDQGTFEKTVIKLDEKVNIVSMVFSGRLLRIFPVENDPSNTWVSPADMREMQGVTAALQEMNLLFSEYLAAAEQSLSGADAGNAVTLLGQIQSNQKLKGAAVVPSDMKVTAELMLNSLDVFGRLRNVYGLFSLAFLVVFFMSVFRSDFPLAKATNWVWYALLAAFAFHTLGLGLRWYISGRAPWSNGYESMIYIGWTTVLAGLLFSRKSLGGMSATSVLAATILLVAGMSWLDPEITPLVPVLKSYWLTIHVSLEAGSYGFLMLGAVIGMLNLVLLALLNDRNRQTIDRVVRELTMISEITLLGGLFMVSIGTYLGGVWANESWGRYWGWDAKETWALVTILVYAFILHMRFMKGLQGIFAFNFASLFGFATVIMTYFGVNYYLSGLHSYAAGDPVPVPSEVYYTTVALAVLSVVSYINYRRRYKM